VKDNTSSKSDIVSDTIKIDCENATDDLHIDFVEKNAGVSADGTSKIDITYRIFAQIQTYSISVTKSINFLDMMLTSHTFDVSNTD
jgi:hypothetical protein